MFKLRSYIKNHITLWGDFMIYHHKFLCYF